MDPQTLPLLPCPFCGGPVNLEKVHIRACSGWDQPMIRGTIIVLACAVALAIILPALAITAPLWAKEKR